MTGLWSKNLTVPVPFASFRQEKQVEIDKLTAVLSAGRRFGEGWWMGLQGSIWWWFPWPKLGYQVFETDGLQWKIPWKWMIWGYPYFGKPPFMEIFGVKKMEHQWIMDNQRWGVPWSRHLRGRPSVNERIFGYSTLYSLTISYIDRSQPLNY